MAPRCTSAQSALYHTLAPSLLLLEGSSCLAENHHGGNTSHLTDSNQWKGKSHTDTSLPGPRWEGKSSAVLSRGLVTSRAGAPCCQRASGPLRPQPGSCWQPEPAHPTPGTPLQRTEKGKQEVPLAKSWNIVTSSCSSKGLAQLALNYNRHAAGRGQRCAHGFRM